MAEQELIPASDVTVTATLDEQAHNIMKQAGGALTIAQSFTVITNDEDCQYAIDERNAILKKIDLMDAVLEKTLAPFAEGVKRVRDLFRPGKTALQEAADYLKPLISNYMLEKDQKEERERQERIEAERKIRQKAEEEAAAMRAKAAEESRQKEAAAKKAEEERLAAVAAGNAAEATAKAEEAARLKQESASVVETAEASARATELDAAATVAASAAAPAAKLEGSGLRDNWVGELLPTVTEEQARLMICEAIAAGNTMLLGLIKLDAAALKKMAAALKNNMQVPGYRAVNKPNLTGSRK